MNKSKQYEFNLKQLQNKTKEFSDKNIIKLKSQNDLIIALKKKYPTFFKISNKGMPYKQFLSGFFNCILNKNNEPFYIKVYNNKELIIFNEYSSSYNYVTLPPWHRYNIIKCISKKSLNQNFSNIRINKDQFMQSLFILFPEFMSIYPKILSDLNDRLIRLKNDTISIKHLYNYLVYCGDKLSKNSIFKNDKKKFKLSKNKINSFLKVFNYKQLIQIIIK